MPGERGILLVSSAVHKIKDVFFALVQSELGDVYMVRQTVAALCPVSTLFDSV